MPRFAFLIFLPFLPGCLAVGYPSITYTPQLPIQEPDVRAFKSMSSGGGMSMVMTGGGWRRASIEEIPLNQGCVESHEDAYFHYLVGGIPVSFSEYRHWSILLYRPGHEIIEIPSRWWGRKLFEAEVDRLEWKPVASTQAQVKALETLCPPFENRPTAGVRQFVASEYERLAAIIRASSPRESANLLSTAMRLKESRSE